MSNNNKCITKFCRNKTKRGNTHCSSCRVRIWRNNNPIEASYLNLKHNAKRRKKEFTISLDYFKQFCYETDYIAGKGRTRGSYTVDRKDETLGYIPGNIQKLEVGANVKKYLHYDWQTKYAVVTTEVEVSKTEWFDE